MLLFKKKKKSLGRKVATQILDNGVKVDIYTGPVSETLFPESVARAKEMLKGIDFTGTGFGSK